MNQNLVVLNEASDVCGPCGGKCCKRSPGFSVPEDWGWPDAEAMKVRLTEALRSGKYTIEYWMFEDMAVRPAAQDDYDVVTNPISDDDSWLARHNYEGAGRCLLLTETGCSLAFDDRPFQCRITEPNAMNPGDCRPAKEHRADWNADSKYQAALEPHKPLLHAIAEEARSGWDAAYMARR